jgi:photosystem II stability/assembly factor-like uncharacterized protein
VALARWCDIGRRRLYPLLAAALLAAAAAAPTQPDLPQSNHLDASRLGWRNIGPAVAGGRVAAVAGTDADPLLYYLGAAGGGIFRTTNGGLTWQDVWPQASVGAIGAVTIAPSDKRVVWAGTGESKPRNDASAGDGVWVSRDGGNHWAWRGLGETAAISRILIDPRDPNRVLVGALGNTYRDSPQRGVFATGDGGRTWRRKLYVGPQSGISDLARDPHDPRVVYAGVWQFRRVPWSFTSGGPRDGLYKSVDGGEHWRRLRGSGLPTDTLGRIGVAVAPDGRRVYALIQSRQGVLWRSDDSGVHWRLMSRDTLINQRPFYMSRLEVDPADRNHVYFLSENLVETRDGGATYHEIAAAVHQDHHGLWIARDGRRMIEANDGGAPISVDGGETWDWRYNLTLGQIYHIGYDDQTPYHVCGGFQDNDVYCGPSDSLSPLGITNGDWRAAGNDGDGTWAWPEPGRPTSIWNVGVNELNGQLGIFDLRSRQDHDISPDVTDTNGRALAGLRYRFNWEAPIAFSPARPGVAYFGGNVLFATSDRGATWTPISPELTRNDPAKQHVAGGPINPDVSGAEFYDTLLDIAPSPVDPNVIWTGSDDGLVQRTDDGGTHWHNVSPPAPPWGRIETVEPSHVSALRAYAAEDRHLSGDPAPYLFATDDAGAHWKAIDGGLPRAEFAHVVREDPRNPDVLYAGLEEGVWFSLDRGAHWEPLRLDMPAVAIHDIRVQPTANDLLVGTHGRGFWVLDDLAPLQGFSAAAGTHLPAIFTPRPAIEWYRWWKSNYGEHQDECCASAGAFAATDPPAGALISYYLPRRAATKPRLDLIDPHGTVVRTFAIPRDAGINRFVWDLSERPPIPWRSAREWNQGPRSGALVLPGTYTVRLCADKTTADAPLEVRPDPRAAWTADQSALRHDFIASLNAEYTLLDRALNTLDDLRVHAAPALRARIDRVRAQLSSNPRNSEDQLYLPDGPRERLATLLGTVALSQGPPGPAHLREAVVVRATDARALAAYRRFFASLPATSKN